MFVQRFLEIFVLVPQPMHNCYKILELPDFASADQIKSAYRRLARKYHPDVTGGDKHLEELFKRVQNAYDVLTDPYDKSSHDSALRNAANPAWQTPSYTTYTYQPPRYNAPVYTAQSPPVVDRKFRKQSLWAVAGLVVLWGFLTILFPYPTSKNDEVSETRQRTSSGYQPPVNAFRLGDPKTVVVAKQGAPTTIVQTSPTEETWSYGYSIVRFREGKVCEYADHGYNLNVAYTNDDADEVTADSFSRGATRSEVFQLQGEPIRVVQFGAAGAERWEYGKNNVYFVDDEVVWYTNEDGQLRVNN